MMIEIGEKEVVVVEVSCGLHRWRRPPRKEFDWVEVWMVSCLCFVGLAELHGRVRPWRCARCQNTHKCRLRILNRDSRQSGTRCTHTMKAEAVSEVEADPDSGQEEVASPWLRMRG